MNKNESNDLGFLYILVILMFLLLVVYSLKINKLEEKIDTSKKIEITK